MCESRVHLNVYQTYDKLTDTHSRGERDLRDGGRLSAHSQASYKDDGVDEGDDDEFREFIDDNNLPGELDDEPLEMYININHMHI